MQWVSMAKQLHAYLTSPSLTLSVGWSNVNHNTTGLWSSGNLFWGVMNQAALCVGLIGESEIDGQL